VAYEKELGTAESEFTAAQQDLNQTATLRQRGWLLADGLLAGSPSTGPGEVVPQRGRVPDSFGDYLQRIRLGSGYSDAKWNLIQPKIVQIISNQLGPIGGLSTLFPEIYRRPSTGPSTMPPLNESRFQIAVSEAAAAMSNPNSSDDEVAAKIEAAMKEKNDSDAANFAAQQDARAVGLSTYQEAVLVFEGLLSVHHR
jgi:hypothetical protein